MKHKPVQCFKKVSKNVSKEFYPHRSYKLAEIYVARNESGELAPKPNWYVYYFVADPTTGKWVMRKKTDGINRIKNLKQRLIEAKHLQSAINKLLTSGFNPLGQPKEESLLSACIDGYLQRHVSTLRDRTISTMRSSLSFLSRYFEAIRKPAMHVTDITRDDIRLALEYWMKKKDWENIQYNNNLSRWRTFFNYLISENSIEKNPTDKIPYLKVYPTDRNRPPNETEFTAIVNHLYENDKQLFLYAMIIYYEGFRVTETGRLRRSDIEFGTEHPYFRLAAKNQKDNEDVIHYVSPHLLNYFYEMGIDKLPPDHYLFSSKLIPGERRMSKIKDVAEVRWQQQVKQHLGIPVDLYSLKHKQATELGDNASTKDISKFLRHSSEEITKVYMKKYKPVVSIEFFKNQRPLPLKSKK